MTKVNQLKTFFVFGFAALGFLSCTHEAATGSMVANIVKEKETVVVTQSSTSEDFTTEYIYVQTLDGTGYEKVDVLDIIIPTGTEFSSLASDYGISVPGCTIKGTIEQQVSDGSYVLNIYFDRNLITYSFYSDDTLVESVTGLYGTSFTAPSYQTKTGYWFVRWIDEDGNDIPSVFETESDADFYAEWKAARSTYGTKSAPDAIGDIVFADGSATPYDDSELSELLPEQKDSIVSVIFYIGNQCSTDSASRTLGIGLNNTSGTELAWCTSGAAAVDKFISSIECHPTSSFIRFFSDSEFWYNVNGTDNFLNLQNAVSDADDSSKYPSWAWVNSYAAKNSLPDGYQDGWYMPSVAELAMLYCSKDKVNAALAAVGGTQLYEGFYVSSSQVSNWDDLINSKKLAWGIWFTDGEMKSVSKTYAGSVCAIREF